MIRRFGRLLVAVVVLIAGIFALLINFGYFTGEGLKELASKWWPLILVLAGAIMLYEYLIDYRQPANPGGNGLF